MDEVGALVAIALVCRRVRADGIHSGISGQFYRQFA
jgi:hypothetical protein